MNGEFTLWSSFGFIADKSMGNDDVMRAMTFNKAGDYLISTSMGGKIYYWTPQMLKLNEFTGHTHPCRAVSVAPTDLKFVTGGDDVTVKIWDFETSKEEMSLSGHSFDVKTVEWHPQKSLVLSGSRDHTAKLWDPSTGKELITIRGHKNTVTCARWNPINGNIFCTASRDKTIRVYDVRFIRKEEPCLYTLLGHTTEVYSAAWHPKHESLLATGSYDGSLFYWMCNGADKESYAQAIVPAAHEGSIWAMQWSPAGHLLCTGSQDKTCKFWSRMRPGMSELLLYQGYTRKVDELDVMREMHQAPPTMNDYMDFKDQATQLEEDETFVNDLEKQDDPKELEYTEVINVGKQHLFKSLSQHQVERHMAAQKIPCLGEVGTENASTEQPGLANLLPPEAFSKKLNDGRSYEPKPDSSELIAALNSGLLSRQRDHSAGAGPLGTDSLNLMQASSNSAAQVGPNDSMNQMDQQRHRGQQQSVDPMSLPDPRVAGWVKHFDEERGYGFIKTYDPQYPDLYAVKNDIIPGYGKGGAQSLEKLDFVLCRAEEGPNRATGRLQWKAKQICHADYDKERFDREQKAHGGGAGAAAPGGNNRYDNHRGGADNRYQNRQDHHRRGDHGHGGRDQRDRDHYGHGGGRDQRQHHHQQGRHSHGSMPPPGMPPPGMPPHHQGGRRPEGYGTVTQDLLELLARHQSDFARMQDICRNHGVSMEQVQETINQLRG